MSVFGVSLVCIQSKCEKIRTRKTPNMETFCGVWLFDDKPSVYFSDDKSTLTILSSKLDIRYKDLILIQYSHFAYLGLALQDAVCGKSMDLKVTYEIIEKHLL